nr:hypothetical protein [Tanacetum cinerariifolium]
MPTTTDPINTTTITNVSQSVVDENLPQLLDSRGGSRVTNVLDFDKEDFTSEKVIGPFTRLKCLLNNLENNGVAIFQAEVNATFVNSLPRKWLSMNQTQRENNSIKNDRPATLYGKYNYEEDVEEDQRTSDEFMADLNNEYHERALLANQKRFYKRSGRVGSARKPLDKAKETCFACGKRVIFKRNAPKIKPPHHPIHPETTLSTNPKPTHLLSTKHPLRTLDDESVSSDDELCTKIRAFMAIAGNESSVGKDDARSGQWVDITMEKVHRLLSMTDCDERKHVLDYTHVDLHYVEDQKKNFVNKFNLLKQEISLHKSELCNLKNTMSINCSLQNEVIRVNLENESLKDEIIDLKKEPFPPLPKLIGAAPSDTSEYIISLSDLTFNMADFTLDIHVPKKTRPFVNVSTTYVIKKKSEKSPTIPIPCFDKKADLSTQQLLLTLMKEVKGLKKQIEIPSGTPSLSSQPSSSKSNKQKTCFGPCKHCGFKNHLSDDCYSKPKCSTCGSTDHLTKEHLEHVAIKKILSKIKAESPMKPLPKRAPMILKPFKECKYCGFNDHHSDDCELYPRCEVCGSIAHEPSVYPKKHPNFKRPRIANRQSEPTKK